MDGHGVEFLSRLLGSIESQSYTDHETIVSDHSLGSEIAQLCRGFPKVKYFKNPKKRGNSSANLNHALTKARGDFIKIIFQDDFLSGPDSLGRMMAALGRHAWLVHGYWHTDLSGEPREAPMTPSIPETYDGLFYGNTIGAPTAILFKRNALRFDEGLVWMMDCDFYFKLLKRFGLPVIIDEPLAVQTLWPGQISNKIDRKLKEVEAAYVRKKYRSKIRSALSLARKIMRRE